MELNVREIEEKEKEGIPTANFAAAQKYTYRERTGRRVSLEAIINGERLQLAEKDVTPQVKCRWK